MTLRNPPTLLLAALVGLVVSACGGDAKDTPAPASKATTRHSCTIMLARKAEEYKGNASGEDEKLTLEAAWTAVCAKLPEAERAHCKDESKYGVMKMVGSGTSGGKTNYNIDLTLTSKPPTHEGKGESETAKEEACKTALEQACKAAGESGDCLASGKLEKQGQSTSSQRIGM
jgi:hypothetical protein